MMERFSNLGITTTVTNDKLKIEISISGLASGFNDSPNNYEEIKIKPGQKRNFAKYIAKKIIEEADQETGESFVMGMFEKSFEDIFEGYDVEDEILKYPEGGEE